MSKKLSKLSTLGVYGKIAKIRLHKALVTQRPTEVKAALHMRNPNDPLFVPPAEVPSLLYCCLCRKRKPHKDFDIARRNTLRANRRTECKACRAEVRKRIRLEKKRGKAVGSPVKHRPRVNTKTVYQQA